ncbi:MULTISPECIES: OmpA family protein [Hymenobacter]|uniref:Outer membrane protein OmpA n=1 Tax=Hymenobacter mucosus TaxID=1411120 RepID=A0A238Z1Q0_9BACT|nr:MULTISPECIES: OmpA family protein [Hymenobacter]SNR77296.1 Outer membrane protein OmpA [Hymenobacter mucosus]
MKKHLLSLFAAAALLSACNDLKKPEEKDQPQEATNDTAVVYRNGETAGEAANDAVDATKDAANKVASATENAWDMTKAKLADVKYEEIDLPEVSVRSDDNYSVYGLEEKVLFDTDKAVIKPSATRALSEIGASIARRYKGADVRIMGFADSRGDKSYNKELSEQRAEAVRNWLQQNVHIEASRLSVEPMGESAPVASNSTAAGRQENRRVEIAVKR